MSTPCPCGGRPHRFGRDYPHTCQHGGYVTAVNSTEITREHTIMSTVPDPADRRYRTADGVLITDGMLAINYDRRATRVTFGGGEFTRPGTEYWDGWFECVHPTTGERMSTMNGERLSTKGY